MSIKEVKFRPKIGKGDFDTKVRKVTQFLHEGHKVKVTLQFRGREMAHPELGSKILDQVLDEVGAYVKVETQARLEGRNMTMVLAPDKKALDEAAKAAEPTADAERPASPSVEPTRRRTGAEAASTSRQPTPGSRHRPPSRSGHPSDSDDPERSILAPEGAPPPCPR